MKHLLPTLAILLAFSLTSQAQNEPTKPSDPSEKIEAPAPPELNEADLEEMMREQDQMIEEHELQMEKMEQALESQREEMERVIEVEMVRMEEVMEAVNLAMKVQENYRDEHMEFATLQMEEELLEMEHEMMKIDLSGCFTEVSAHRDFQYNLVRELARDGYIDPSDKSIDVRFTKKKIEVNGEPIEEKHIEKYKKLRKEHYGDDGSMTLKIDLDDC
jgi:hypothetical protein